MQWFLSWSGVLLPVLGVFHAVGCGVPVPAAKIERASAARNLRNATARCSAATNACLPWAAPRASRIDLQLRAEATCPSLQSVHLALHGRFPEQPLVRPVEAGLTSLPVVGAVRRRGDGALTGARPAAPR